MNLFTTNALYYKKYLWIFNEQYIDKHHSYNSRERCISGAEFIAIIKITIHNNLQQILQFFLQNALNKRYS